jgi:hypothetical protein
MAELQWRVGSNGNSFADHERGRYCVATVSLTIGVYFHLTLDGKSIGGGNDFESVKAMAELHAKTGRVTETPGAAC